MVNKFHLDLWTIKKFDVQCCSAYLNYQIVQNHQQSNLRSSISLAKMC